MLCTGKESKSEKVIAIRIKNHSDWNIQGSIQIKKKSQLK